MHLINVIFARYDSNGLINCELMADLGRGAETLPYTYSPDDPHGLAPAVGQWLVDHPEFEIGDAEVPPPTTGDVHAERDRRLAAGFSYDFGDERGVHFIKTTPADMLGWDEVTKLAQALINGGQPTTPITIATGSGIAQVTAMEWQGVLLAAAAFRQPIWAASFVLEQMNPIPADYADDEYWG